LPQVPFVVRLDGTNDKEGRALLAEANLPNVHTEATMLRAAEKVVKEAERSPAGQEWPEAERGDQNAGRDAPRS
jgi:hypothetical protein